MRLKLVALVLACVACSLPNRVCAAPAKSARAEPEHYTDGAWDVRATRTAPGRVRIEYADGRSSEAGLDEHAILQLAPGELLAPALARHELALVRPLLPSAGLYLVRSLRAGEDGLTIAARLRGDPQLRAVPDLALGRRRASIHVPPNDPRYGGQWYLESLSIEQAWRRSTGGKGTAIVIVDDGCDLGHPDLSARLEPGKDVVDGDDDPSFEPGVEGNAHGTACAGIAAAAGDNGQGIAGTCPECQLRCIRLLAQNGKEVLISADVQAFALALEWGAAVSSNSWGFVDAIPAPAPFVTAARELMQKGRNGKGAFVVFAAGNESRTVGEDEIYGIDGVITVGATNAFDEAAPFSNQGSPLDVVAPAGTLTTDIRGADGLDPGDYTGLFGGTSSACPVVAGVLGLLTSLAPDARAEDIQAALIDTARPAPFATPDAQGHDALYGFGIVDPVAAMEQLVPSAADAGAPDHAQKNTDDGGCSCGVPHTGSLDLGPALVVGVFAFARFRRRR